MAISGQFDALALLAELEAPTLKPMRAGEAGTFLNPGHPDTLADIKEAHFKLYSVDQGNWRRYRGWSTYYESSGYGSAHHSQKFNADLRCHHLVAEPCTCVGDYLSRIYCAGCEWWSGIHTSSNAAVHEYLDHCWPGWRDLPVIESTPKANGTYAYAFPDDYPEEWKVPGAPMLDCRGLTKYGTRDVPGGNPFGGYKVAMVRECKQHKGDQ